MDRTLSCLSCLQFIGDMSKEKNNQRGVFDSSMIDAEGSPALTLACGHSICKACFETHSDPKSKDSLVFCEDCHQETKNRHLKELKTFRNLCSCWRVLRNDLSGIKDLVEGLNMEVANSSEVKLTTNITSPRQSPRASDKPEPPRDRTLSPRASVNRPKAETLGSVVVDKPRMSLAPTSSVLAGGKSRYKRR